MEAYRGDIPYIAARSKAHLDVVEPRREILLDRLYLFHDWQAGLYVMLQPSEPLSHVSAGRSVHVFALAVFKGDACHPSPVGALINAAFVVAAPALPLFCHVVALLFRGDHSPCSFSC